MKMERLRLCWMCIKGPPLYRRHKTRTMDAMEYRPLPTENIGSSILSWIRLMTGILYWTSPFLVFPMYKRGWFTVDGVLFAVKYAGVTGFLWCTGILLQGLGRIQNAEYLAFVAVLHQALNQRDNATARKTLALYDFGFRCWPVDYDVLSASGESTKTRNRRLFQEQGSQAWKKEAGLWELLYGPLSYVAAHTFGRRMMYPGCTALVNSMVHPALIEGRAKMIDRLKGKRAKLRTALGNEVDSMFIDRRGDRNFANGDILVLCFEGNSGFYEIGCPNAPIEAGYSVLGANRPGFACSQGAPWPYTERDFAESLFQYATDRLSFPPERIVVLAWSIGGYPASYLASKYPDIKAVILDATFDDALPLAVPRMPLSLSSLTTRTVRQYLNLNVADLLTQFRGPVRLYRRYKDEMISTEGPDNPGTNRGNALLQRFLASRYPELMGERQNEKALHYLLLPPAQTEAYLLEEGVDSTWCERQLTDCVREALRAEDGTSVYPLSLGQGLDEEQKSSLLLYLMHQTLTQLDTSHCTPLPPAQLKLPWDPVVLARR